MVTTRVGEFAQFFCFVSVPVLSSAQSKVVTASWDGLIKLWVRAVFDFDVPIVTPDIGLSSVDSRIEWY